MLISRDGGALDIEKALPRSVAPRRTTSAPPGTASAGVAGNKIKLDVVAVPPPAGFPRKAKKWKFVSNFKWLGNYQPYSVNKWRKFK